MSEQIPSDSVKIKPSAPKRVYVYEVEGGQLIALREMIPTKTPHSTPEYVLKADADQLAAALREIRTHLLEQADLGRARKSARDALDAYEGGES